jgi:hypothetical protein
MTAEDKEYINELREADRRYYVSQIAGLLQYFQSEIIAMRRAVDEYNATNNERWTGANEFRGQLKDQAGTFVTRRELWGAVIAVISIVLAVVQLLIKFQGQ